MEKYLEKKKSSTNSKKEEQSFFGPAANANFFAPVIQAKLAVNQPGDVYEQEADAVADKVMKTSSSVAQPLNDSGQNITSIQRTESAFSANIDAGAEAAINNSKGTGTALPASVKANMEQQLNHDFSSVKIHNDANAAQLNQSLNARAFTTGNDIYFNKGENIHTNEGKHLLAHELTHVVQQGGGNNNVQRKIELRPPGKGEATAFDRKQEIVDRLNTLTTAGEYTLDDKALKFTIKDNDKLTFFDKQMIDFIKKDPVVPLRLITGKGMVGNKASGYKPLVIDEFQSGYLDVDDMMASDDASFQMNMMHILTERFSVKNYDARLGTASLFTQDSSGETTPEFKTAHQKGLTAETNYLRDVTGDKTLKFIGESESGNTATFTYKSDEGYRIFHTFTNTNKNISAGKVTVKTTDKRTISLKDFIAERSADPYAG